MQSMKSFFAPIYIWLYSPLLPRLFSLSHTSLSSAGLHHARLNTPLLKVCALVSVVPDFEGVRLISSSL